MDPLIAGGVIEGIGSMVSSAIGAQSAHKQEMWQGNMSNTAHQREVQDLEKAGLNPMLSGMGGSGASTPQGTMFTPGNPAQGITQAALQSSMNQKQKEGIQADIDTKKTQQTLNSASAAKEISVANLNNMLKEKAEQDKLTSAQQEFLNNMLKRKADQDRLTSQQQEYSTRQDVESKKYINLKQEADTELYRIPFVKEITAIYDKLTEILHGGFQLGK
nr:MAG: DNA pilot protein [Microviridae sp.]